MSTLTRRHVLALAGAAALPAAARTLVAGHPWVYAATRPKNDIYDVLDGIFADMHAAGLDAIELMSSALVPDGAVERIRELSRKHRLPVIGMSYSGAMSDREQHPAIVADLEKLLPRLQKVGGRTMGTSVGATRAPKTPAQFDAQADVLRKAIAMCRDHGVVLNLHNHVYEVANQEHDLRGTLERIPDVKLGPDLNWLLRAGVDPVDFIRRHGPSIVYAHLRDQKRDGKWPEAMGEGDMDYTAIGNALRAVKFSGDLCIELAHERGSTPTRPLGESFRLSRQYVKRTMRY